MTLPKGFVFSQSSLQDYVDCQRRFQLRYMDHLAWPAVEAEPFLENEKLIDRGARFHKIIHQSLIGIPEDQISISLADDQVVVNWWENYLHSVQHGNLLVITHPGIQRFEEISCSAPVGDFRLIAKYDLLIYQPDQKVTIIDWKTSQNHPKRKWLADRLQTHVYPFVLAMTGSTLVTGSQVSPNNIEMIYWFTNQPDQPEHFCYNDADFHADQTSYLSDLVSLINQKSEPVFPLTPDERRCMFCTYRSLCNRGVKPGMLEFLEQATDPGAVEDVTIDLDQIGEIEF